MKKTFAYASIQAVLLAAAAMAFEAHAFSDASARLEGDCSYHVIRGGSWRDGPTELRSAFRHPVDMRHFKGENFRVARVLAP